MLFVMFQGPLSTRFFSRCPSREWSRMDAMTSIEECVIDDQPCAKLLKPGDLVFNPCRDVFYSTTVPIAGKPLETFVL